MAGQGVKDVEADALDAKPIVVALHEMRGDGKSAGMHEGPAQRVKPKIAFSDGNLQLEVNLNLMFRWCARYCFRVPKWLACTGKFKKQIRAVFYVEPVT